MNIPVTNLLNVFSSPAQFWGFIGLVAAAVFVAAASIEAIRGKLGKAALLLIIMLVIEWIAFGEMHGGITFS